MSEENVIGKWAGIFIAGGAAIGLILWGVPFYIESKVAERVSAHLETLDNDPSKHPSVVSNKTRLDNLETTASRIEGKVDAFSGEFMRYLERESVR